MDFELLTPRDRENLRNTFDTLNKSFEDFRNAMDEAAAKIDKLAQDHPTLFTD